MLGCIAQIDAFDPIAAAPVILRIANCDDAAVCHLNGQTWWPAMSKAPTLRYDLFDGDFSGQITSPSSSFTMQIEAFPDIARYELADARIQLWTGTVGEAWANWTLRFAGRVSGQPAVQDQVATIAFGVDDKWLDKALLSTYAGTGGAEGPAALKGQAKPLALGTPRYVSGVLIDSLNSVFQISGYGAIQSIDVALEKLARFSPSIGDYPTYAALVAASIPAGRWATATAVGMARFGAPPTGTISFLVQGDVTGPDGLARKPGQLIRRIALLAGGAGRIDDASLNALDAARAYNLSNVLTEQTTARSVIQAIASSVNAVAGVSWTGQLFVVPIAVGSPVATLAADGSALPPVANVQQIEIAAPFSRLTIGAERAWTVHALSDIAFSAALIPLGIYAAATSYREGNIVSLGNGSEWLYVNATPSAGNAPPSATYWQQLKPPQTYNDGTPIENLKPAQAGADVTGTHTAAAILGQGQWATTDISIFNVTGTAPNLVFNGGLTLLGNGFTYDPAAWNFVFGGNGEGYLAATGIGGTNAAASRSISAAQGIYTLQALMFAGGMTAGNFVVDVLFLNASDAILSSPRITAVNGSGWTQYGLTVAAPAGTVRAVLRFFTESATNTNAAVRRLKLARTTEPTIFSDEATNSAVYGDNASIDSLKPAQPGANVTQTNVASAIFGQGPAATLAAVTGLIALVDSNTYLGSGGPGGGTSSGGSGGGVVREGFGVQP